MAKYCIAFIFISFSLSLLQVADSLTPKTHRRPYDPNANKIGGRIVKGTEVKENKLPYQAALLLTNTTTNESFTCGGSIIDENWILTAAHCLEGMDTAKIRVGSVKFSSGGQEIEVNSTSFILHSQYNISGTIINDIALINLKETPITLDKQSVKVIKPVSKNKACSKSNKLVVSGYGRSKDNGETSEVLLQTSLGEVSTYDCVNAYGIDSVPSTIVCAKGKDGEDSCQGDSGGPLVSGQNLVGIVSFGAVSCEAGAAGVYTRVASYADWIRGHTGISYE